MNEEIKKEFYEKFCYKSNAKVPHLKRIETTILLDWIESKLSRKLEVGIIALNQISSGYTSGDNVPQFINLTPDKMKEIAEIALKEIRKQE